MKRGDPVHTYALELLHRREVSGDQLAIFVALFDARRAADPDARRRRRDAAHGQAAAILAGQYSTHDTTDAARRRRLQPVIVAVLGDDATCDMFPDPAPWEVMRAADMDLARVLFTRLAAGEPWAFEGDVTPPPTAAGRAAEVCGHVLASLAVRDGECTTLLAWKEYSGVLGAEVTLAPSSLRRLLQLARDFGGTRL